MTRLSHAYDWILLLIFWDTKSLIRRNISNMLNIHVYLNHLMHIIIT